MTEREGRDANRTAKRARSRDSAESMFPFPAVASRRRGPSWNVLPSTLLPCGNRARMPSLRRVAASKAGRGSLVPRDEG
jgi:hypothetical protein